MNYLAHIFLAQQSDQAMLGALLGDFVKASDTARYALPIQTDIILHRKIDSYTDSHPLVLDARRLFQPQHRRYAGILLDVFYDHVLSQHWSRYSDAPMQDLIARFYTALQAHESILPDKLQRALPYMVSQDWLGSYQDFAGVDFALRRVSQRLSKNGHLLREGIADLETHHAALSAGFLEFFPELIAYVAEQRQNTALVLPPSVMM